MAETDRLRRRALTPDERWIKLLRLLHARFLHEVEQRHPRFAGQLRAFSFDFREEAALQEATRPADAYLRWGLTYLRTRPLPPAPRPGVAAVKQARAVLYDVLVRHWRAAFAETRIPKHRRRYLVACVVPTLQVLARPQRTARDFRRALVERFGTVPPREVIRASEEPLRSAARGLLRTLRNPERDPKATQFIGGPGACLMQLLGLTRVEVSRYRLGRRTEQQQSTGREVKRLRRLARHAQDPETLVRAQQGLRLLQ